MFSSTRGSRVRGELSGRRYARPETSSRLQPSWSLSRARRTYARQMSWASSEPVRRAMVSNRSKNTSLELRVRRALYTEGLRYRLHYRVPGSTRRTIDIAFPGKRIGVFVDGCFWHGCPVHYVAAKTNAVFWAEKAARNQARDRETDAMLEAVGWIAVRFWEHESTDAIVRRILELVRPPGCHERSPR